MCVCVCVCVSVDQRFNLSHHCLILPSYTPHVKIFQNRNKILG